MTQTGPRSLEAKARVSTNAVKHGLRSTKVVIPGLELQKDWDTFLADSIATLNPVGAIEYALADRIVALLWRLRRIVRAERDGALLGDQPTGNKGNQLLDNVYRFLEGVRQTYGWIGGADPIPPPGPQASPAPSILPAPARLQSLSTHEYRLSRQLLHAMNQLRSLQDQRRRGDQPSPDPDGGSATPHLARPEDDTPGEGNASAAHEKATNNRNWPLAV